MKRFLSLTVVLVMVLGLAACGGSASGGKQTPAPTEAAAPTLSLGFAQKNITPTESVPLSGYGDSTKRMSQGMLDYLYATVVAITDENGQTVIMVVMDLGNVYSPVTKYRTQIAKELGLDESQLMFCGTHTHSAPHSSKKGVASITGYNTMLEKALTQGVQEALDDRKPVTGVYYGSAETEGMNFVRRYVMKDGSYAGDNYGNHSLGYAGHESEVDNLLQLVKFTRDGGKDVVFTNFQTHPHRTGGSTKYDISADIVGIYRQELEKSLDCHAIYFTGASGNVNPTSRIESENIAKDYKEHGKMLAGYGVKAAETFQPLELGQVAFTKTVYRGETNHSEDHLLPYAKEVVDRYNGGMTTAEAVKGYTQYGIQTYYHAAAIVSHAQLGKTMDAPLYGFRVGDFALVFAPFELFDQLGKDIREGSPFGATFVCCYANDGLGYIPTQLGFDHGGYGAYKCNYKPGVGELLVQEYLTILNTLYETK